MTTATMYKNVNAVLKMNVGVFALKSDQEIFVRREYIVGRKPFYTVVNGVKIPLDYEDFEAFTVIE